LQNDVEQLNTDMKDAKTFINAMDFVGSNIGSSIVRVDNLVHTSAANTAEVKEMKDGTDGKIADLKSEVTRSLTDSTDSLQDKLDKMTAENVALKAKVAFDAAAQTATLNKMVAEKTTAMDAKIATLTKFVDDIDMGDTLGIFVGGNRKYAHGGTHTFNLDRVDYNSAAPYFKVEGDGFKIQKSGVYEMAWRVLSHGGWCHAHMRVYIDGRQVNGATHHYIPGTWQDMHIHETFTMEAGQRIHTTVSACGHAWHPSTQNNNKAHNRMMFRYIGQVGKDCKGPFCKKW
jgi:hypothetical protein